MLLLVLLTIKLQLLCHPFINQVKITEPLILILIYTVDITIRKAFNLIFLITAISKDIVGRGGVTNSSKFGDALRSAQIKS